MVESTALEMRRAGNGTVGSNPTLSAITKSLTLKHFLTFKASRGSAPLSCVPGTAERRASGSLRPNGGRFSRRELDSTVFKSWTAEPEANITWSSKNPDGPLRPPGDAFSNDCARGASAADGQEARPRRKFCSCWPQSSVIESLLHSEPLSSHAGCLPAMMDLTTSGERNARRKIRVT